MKYRAKHLVEYALLRGFMGSVNLLPYRLILLLAWFFARVSFILSASKRRRTARRIQQVFGDQFSPAAIRAISWVAWRNLVFNAVEIMRVPSITRAWVEKVADLTEFHKLPDCMKDGRGVMLAVPHMGNWDFAGVSVQLLGVPLAAIARRQKNPLVNAHLNRMREHTGMEALERRAFTLKDVVAKLEAGKAVAILPDVHAHSGAIPVHYLGGQALIPRGMALFARAARVPILPAYVMRSGWRRHIWRGFDPIYPDFSLDEEEDLRRMTQYVMDCFEHAVRKHPDQYFWFNKRWVLGAEPAPP